MNQTLRFAYAGSPINLPAQTLVSLHVPAKSSLRVSRRHVHNGRAVTFSGRIPTLPIPAGGKLVELQVHLSGRWQTFRTTRSDPSGRWAIRYRFKRTRGVQRFRFRVWLPREASFPFGAGKSSVVAVRVRGELTSDVYPSGSDPGHLEVLYITDQVGNVALAPNTAAGSKAFRCVTSPLN